MITRDVEARLVAAQRNRQDVMHAYREAIELAVENEWTNTRIARTLGVSEAAVRMYRKRHGMNNPKEPL